MLHELQKVADKGGDLEMCDDVHGATPVSDFPFLL